MPTRSGRGIHRANMLGLLLSTVYLGWGVVALQHVERVARASLQAQGLQAERVLVTPTFFNSLLWRVVALDGAHYHEGFYSLRGAEPRIAFDRFDRGIGLAGDVQGIDGVRRIAAFSKGFYKLQDEGDRVLVSDLRMGQEPNYIFTFVIARRESPPVPLDVPEQVGSRPDLARGLPWLWRRALGELLPPPR